MKTTAIILTAVLVSGSAARADWDPNNPLVPQQSTNHKMHWPQMPDLTLNGLDVLAGPIAYPAGSGEPYEKFLADDWGCTQTGPVTGIHIWGSYNEDIWLIDTAAGNLPYFSLVIYDNIPPGVGDIPYSRPGRPLWDAYVQPRVERIYAENIREGFYDPNQDVGGIAPPFNGIIGQDTICVQYNFDFDPSVTDPFIQNEGDIYWLGVHHTFDLDNSGVVDLMDLNLLAAKSPGAFGWKTAEDPFDWHFEDDAVWTDVDTWNSNGHVVPSDTFPGSAPTRWNELRYPFGHPYEGMSMDLAFVITPEPGTMALLGLGGALALIRRHRRAM